MNKSPFNATPLTVCFEEEGEEIMMVEATSITFKIGDVIELAVEVKENEGWDVEPVPLREYKVKEMKSSWIKRYGTGMNLSVTNILYVNVVVERHY